MANLRTMHADPTIKHIFHPNDLTGSSHTAFAHALKLTLAFRGTLTMLHMGHRDQAWAEMPRTRITLKRWGLINDESDTAEFETLGIGIRKVVAKGTDPVEVCSEYLSEHPADLIVLSTHQEPNSFLPLQRKVAEPLARSAGRAALFLPHRRPGFVDANTGSIRLKRILMPVTSAPDPMVTLRAVALLVERLSLTDVECTLLHVGTDRTMPDPVLPELTGCSWNVMVKQGDVVEAIVAVQQELGSDLIVMGTEGHNDFLDALRGSTTERVLKLISCPLLAWRV